MIFWGLTAIFAVMSGILLAGKGGFLISGYNTLSQEKKAMYDEKKMCRVMGVGMSVITVMLIMMAVMGDNIPAWFGEIFLGVIIIDIIIMMIWTNKKCYAKDANGNRIVKDAQTLKNEKSSKKLTLIVCIILAVFFIVIGIVLMTGDIKIVCTQDNIQITATYYSDCEIKYDDITKVSLSETNVAGTRVNGFGSFKLAMGRFEDKQNYGRYTRYTYISGDACIIIETKNNGIYVINCKNNNETKALYDNITSIVNK